MSCSHVYGGCQRGNPNTCDSVQVRAPLSSWEPCPAKHHMILVYIFLRLFPLVWYLVCNCYISSLWEEWRQLFLKDLKILSPQAFIGRGFSLLLGEDFSPCIISEISDAVHPNNVTVAQLKFPATEKKKKYIYARISDFINVPEKIADIALSNFPFCTG